MASRSQTDDAAEFLCAIAALAIVALMAVGFCVGSGCLMIWIANTLFAAGWDYSWSRIFAAGASVMLAHWLLKRRSKD